MLPRMLTTKLMPATIADMCPCSKYGCKPTDKMLLMEEKIIMGILNTLIKILFEIQIAFFMIIAHKNTIVANLVQ